MDDTPAPRRYPTVPFGTLLGRALRLKCPRCGEAPMFSGPFATHERCSHCDFKFERDPGFFLGSIYVNYGLTALTITFLFVVLQFGFGWTSRELAIPLTVFCLVFPALMFRHTRAIWLAMDCNWDASAMEIEDDAPESSGVTPDGNG